MAECGDTGHWPAPGTCLVTLARDNVHINAEEQRTEPLFNVIPRGRGATMNKYIHSINNSMQPSLGFSLARYTDIFIDFKIVDTPAFY